jgi:hypothetical protein
VQRRNPKLQSPWNAERRMNCRLGYHAAFLVEFAPFPAGSRWMPTHGDAKNTK